MENQTTSSADLSLGPSGVLNHVIDGFLIQESTEPFPVAPFPFQDLPTLLATNRTSTPPRLQPGTTLARLTRSHEWGVEKWRRG